MMVHKKQFIHLPLSRSIKDPKIEIFHFQSAMHVPWSALITVQHKPCQEKRILISLHKIYMHVVEFSCWWAYSWKNPHRLFRKITYG